MMVREKTKKLNRKSVCSYNRTLLSSKIRKQITKLIPSHRSQIPLKYAKAVKFQEYKQKSKNKE